MVHSEAHRTADQEVMGSNLSWVYCLVLLSVFLLLFFLFFFYYCRRWWKYTAIQKVCFCGKTTVIELWVCLKISDRCIGCLNDISVAHLYYTSIVQSQLQGQRKFAFILVFCRKTFPKASKLHLNEKVLSETEINPYMSNWLFHPS